MKIRTGCDVEQIARFEELLKEYSEKEIYIERYFDFGLMAEILSRQFN